MSDSTGLRYGLTSVPRGAPLLSMQHVLTMLGATVAVPMLVGDAFGLDQAMQAQLISNVLIAMGVATLIQVTIGTRLPIIQGSSFAFLPALFLVATYYSGAEGIQFAMGAIIVGGVFQALLGFSQLAGVLQRVLSPVVVGPTIMAIGLSLFSTAASQASASWPIAILAIALVFAIGFFLPRLSGGSKQGWLSAISTFPVFLTVVLITGAAALGTLVGIFQSGHALHFPFEAIATAGFFKTSPLVFSWGMPRFDIAFLVVFLVAYLVSTIESLGDYNACHEIVSGSDEALPAANANRGVLAEGIACVIAGVLGAAPTTSYSENIGLVGLTRVGSRRVVMNAAIILIACGLVPVFAAVLAGIPTAVMGGLYCVLFGMIAGIGLRYTARADLRSMRNIAIIGFSLFFGMAAQSYLAQPEGQAALRGGLPPAMFDVVFGVVSSSMAVTAVCALTLDLLIPARAGERGR